MDWQRVAAIGMVASALAVVGLFFFLAWAAFKAAGDMDELNDFEHRIAGR